MSLLMKALEKAAKDREETGAESTLAAAPSGGRVNSELTLEPIASAPAAAPAPMAGTPREPTLSPRNPAGVAPAAATPESAQAATVIRAGQRAGGGGAIGAYVREHPLIIFGTLTALFLIGFGGYVYLQMTNPGMFIKQPPRPAQAPPNAPVAQAPAAVEGGVNPALPLATTSLLPAPQEGADKEKPASQASPTARAAPSAAAASPPAAAAQATVEPVLAAPRDAITVTSVDATPSVNPLLAEAYTTLIAGNLESSQRLYNQLLRSDPGNIDALLGLAAIAVQQGDRGAATRHYVKVLELDPRNSLAKASLIGMFGRADPEAEIRLKQLIAREPSAYLQFTLGNLYADRSQWAQAQQEYFRAYQLQPDNPDYAYNLAVALEHISQPKPALDYYRRAVQFAAAKGRANFSTAAAQERISRLEKIVQ